MHRAPSCAPYVLPSDPTALGTRHLEVYALYLTNVSPRFHLHIADYSKNSEEQIHTEKAEMRNILKSYMLLYVIHIIYNKHLIYGDICLFGEIITYTF